MSTAPIKRNRAAIIKENIDAGIVAKRFCAVIEQYYAEQAKPLYGRDLFVVVRASHSLVRFVFQPRTAYNARRFPPGFAVAISSAGLPFTAPSISVSTSVNRPSQCCRAGHN
jgi:hypothetical protein